MRFVICLEFQEKSISWRVDLLNYGMAVRWEWTPVNNKSLPFAEQGISFAPLTVTAMLLTQSRMCCASCMALRRRRSYLESMRVETTGVARMKEMGKCNGNVVGKILWGGMGDRGVDCKILKWNLRNYFSDILMFWRWLFLPRFCMGYLSLSKQIPG